MKTLHRPSTLVIGLLMAFVAVAAFGQNTLAVTGAAALNGTNFGLEVILDGSTNNVFVRDDSPADESVYRAIFWLDPNALTMNAFDRTAVISGRSAGNLEIIRLQLQHNGFSYRVRAACLNNAGVFKFARVNGNAQKYIVIGDNSTEVTLETVFDNSNLGSCELSANGQTIFNNGYQAGSYAVTSIRFGTKNPNPTMSGTYYLDEFSSFRTLAP